MLTIPFVSLMLACNGNKDDTGFYIDITPDSPKPSEPSDEDTDLPEPDDPDTDTDNEDSGNTNNGDPEQDNDGDGYSENQGDCDDSNGQVFPGGVDFPNDDIDQDCSGSPAELVDVLDGVVNSSFDEEDPENLGYPLGWSNIGGAYSIQLDGENIFTEDGDTGQVFVAHTTGGAAVKVWADYGNNPSGEGSIVFQEFVATDEWSPAGQIYWLDLWGYHSETEPLQGTAEASGWIRCFDADYNIDGESQTQRITEQTQLNSWRKLATWVHCGPNANSVQVIVSLQQMDVNTDHGAVYFDDLVFGEAN